MTETDTLLEQLRSAEQRVQEIDASLAPHKPDDVAELETQLREFDRILDTYEDRATGSGDFGGYVSFRATIDNFVETLPDDVPERAAFESMQDAVDKRRLSKRDFEAARNALEPARELVALLEQRREATDAVESAREAIGEHIETIEAEIAECERLLSLATLDFDAPVEQLNEPFQTYNEAVASDFSTYLRSVPALDVLELFSLGHQYPLLDIPEPSDPLIEYVRSTLPSATIHEVLEYAGYSSSKLAHFVDDPQAFRAAVAPEQTYLERLSAAPFQLAWPPEPADHLTWKLQELQSLVNRFASESTISALREVEAVIRDRERFEDLRAVAQAIETTTPEDRARIVSGSVADELESYRSQRDRLESALADAH